MPRRRRRPPTSMTATLRDLPRFALSTILRPSPSARLRRCAMKAAAASASAPAPATYGNAPVLGARDPTMTAAVGAGAGASLIDVAVVVCAVLVVVGAGDVCSAAARLARTLSLDAEGLAAARPTATTIESMWELRRSWVRGLAASG